MVEESTVQVTTGAAATKGKIQAFDQSISDQVSAYMRDPSRMVNGMQQRRSAIAIFGMDSETSNNTKAEAWDTTSISLTAGCDLFMRYVTRTSALEYEDFNSTKSRLLERAEKFGMNYVVWKYV